VVVVAGGAVVVVVGTSVLGGQMTVIVQGCSR
jgi:hypothetical protein